MYASILRGMCRQWTPTDKLAAAKTSWSCSRGLFRFRNLSTVLEVTLMKKNMTYWRIPWELSECQLIRGCVCCGRGARRNVSERNLPRDRVFTVYRSWSSKLTYFMTIYVQILQDTRLRFESSEAVEHERMQSRFLSFDEVLWTLAVRRKRKRIEGPICPVHVWQDLWRSEYVQVELIRNLCGAWLFSFTLHDFTI